MEHRQGAPRGQGGFPGAVGHPAADRRRRAAQAASACCPRARRSRARARRSSSPADGRQGHLGRLRADARTRHRHGLRRARPIGPRPSRRHQGRARRARQAQCRPRSCPCPSSNTPTTADRSPGWPASNTANEHEWIRVEGDVGTIGITNYAQEQLGDVVFVDVPAGRPARSPRASRSPWSNR